MRHWITIGLFIAVLSLLLPVTMAQDITKGSIAGVVRDSTGAVIPDANVTLTSPTGEKKAKTNSIGEYVFINLQPGPDYAVAVDKQGFATGKVAGLSVGLNQRTTADLTLQVGQTTQTVEVTGGGVEAIDLNSTGVGANLNESLYKNVAAGRNISSIIGFAPGVTESLGAGTANPSINGASGLENQYIINGSDVTDPGYGGFGTYSRVFGALGNGVNFDFIQEVQVKSGGFEAQYGQALGGVVNVLTKAGTNNFHGTLYGYFAPQSFEATRPNQLPILVTKGNFGYLQHVGQYDFGGDYGGPIKRDKLFFYGGYNPTFGRSYYLADPSFANYALGTQALKTLTQNYTGKLNWNITQKHSLEGTVFGDPASTNTSYWRGVDTLPAGRPTDNLTTSKLEYGSRTWSGRYTGAMTPNWIVSANYSDHFNDLTETPFANGYRITDNTPVQEKTGKGSFSYGGLGFLENFESRSRQFTVSSSHIFTLWGGHAIDYGYQFEDQPYDDIRVNTGAFFQLPNLPEFKAAAGQTQHGAALTRTHLGVNPNRGISTSNPADPNSPIVLRVTRGEYSNPVVAVGSRYNAGFIQDSWNLNKYITLKPGLRFEQQDMHGTFSRYVFAHNWAPRLGVIVDPTGARKSKFFANWGRFYEKIPADIAIRSFSFESSVIGTFYKDPGQGNQPDLSAANYCGAATHPCGVGVPGSTGLSFQGGPDDATLVYGGTGAEYQDEVVAGYEKEFANNFTFSGRFVYRHMRRIVEDISGINATQANAGVAQQYVISNPNAKLDIFKNPFPCKVGTKGCIDYGDGVGFTDIGDNPLGSDGIPDGFPNPSRIYKAMELVVGRRFSNGIQLYANYVLAKLYGNFQGSYRGDNGQTDPNISSLFDFTNTDGLMGGQAIPGVLPTDRTHQFKFFGNYQWKAINFGLSWKIVTGTPITRLLDHPVYLNNGEIPVCPDGGVVCPGGPRGSLGRTDTYFPLDLHVDYTWKFTEQRNVKFLADLFNVGDQTVVQYVNQNAEINNSPGVPNPDFLKPGGISIVNAYTRPFYARLGIRFEF